MCEAPRQLCGRGSKSRNISVFSISVQRCAASCKLLCADSERRTLDGVRNVLDLLQIADLNRTIQPHHQGLHIVCKSRHETIEKIARARHPLYVANPLLIEQRNCA